MGSTTNYHLPYPEAADTPDVPRDVRGLAQALDALLLGKQATLSDSGWINNDAHVTNATGWDTTSVWYRRVHHTVDLYLHVQRTGAAISVGSSGNITNQDIGSFRPLGGTATPDWCPKSHASFTVANSGGISVWTMDSLGSLDLAAVSPGADIVTGAEWDIQGIYLTG